MIAILINAVDKSADIEQESVRLDMTLSKAPALLHFSMKGEKTIPNLGATVILTEDSVNFFKGTIVEREAKVVGKMVVGYTFVCKDGFHNLDRRLVVKAYNDTDAVAVVQDIIDTFTTGFTLDAPMDESPTVKSIRFNYEQPSRCLEKIANQIGWDWYIDAEDVVHFQPPAVMDAPIVINETNGDSIFSSLEIARNILELKNAIFVRGGEYLDPIAEADAIDRYEADGEQVAFPLVYRYNTVQATIDGTPQTVGVDYLDMPGDYDALYNFQEKMIKWREDNKPSAGEVVRVFGNAFIPLIVEAEDSESITTYGRYEGIEINKSITSIEEAELLANSLLEKWREGSHEGSFKTREKGVRVGQSIQVVSPKFGIDDTYKVNRVRGRMNGHNTFIYEVEFIKSGQTTFTDIMIGLIGRDLDNIEISPDEVIQRFRRLADAFGMTDEIVEITVDSPPYHYAPVSSGNEGRYNFATYT